MAKINGLTDAKNDEATLKELFALIKEYKKLASGRSRSKGYDEGHFEPAMIAMLALLEALYEKFVSLKKERGLQLLDIPHDNEPLNRFRYLAARYHAQKVDDARKTEGIIWLVDHPKISILRKLADQKENLIITLLQDCVRDCERLNKEHGDDQTSQKNQVLEWLDKLQRASEALDKEHRSKISIPVSLVIFSSLNFSLPTLHPHSGFLQACIHEARH